MKSFIDSLNEDKKVSSGLLMYRLSKDENIEVFICQLGGKKWSKMGPRNWSIPKGLVDPGESLIGAAIREFEEETGIKFKWDPKDFIDLGLVQIKREEYRKDVHLWAFEGEGRFKGSNTFKEEWPPGSGKFIDSPEMQRGDFFPLLKARNMVHVYQIPALDRLELEIRKKAKRGK